MSGFMAGRRRMDVRIAADPQDKETTDQRSAKPPAEFTVLRGFAIGGIRLGAPANVLSIHDRVAPQDRSPTVSYRIYFLPKEFAPDSIGNTTTTPAPVIVETLIRAAARKVATLVADVKAPSLGTVLPFYDTINVGQKGYYFCVGVNRVSVEAPPEHMVAAP